MTFSTQFRCRKVWSPTVLQIKYLGTLDWRDELTDTWYSTDCTRRFERAAVRYLFITCIMPRSLARIQLDLMALNGFCSLFAGAEIQLIWKLFCETFHVSFRIEFDYPLSMKFHKSIPVLPNVLLKQLWFRNYLLGFVQASICRDPEISSPYYR